MIAKFRRRFIGLAMATQLFLLAAILLAMNLLNYQAILTEAGTLLATLAQNQGIFPELAAPTREALPADKGPRQPPYSPELPYESRYFSVFYDNAGQAVAADVSHIASVGKSGAVALADAVVAQAAEKPQLPEAGASEGAQSPQALGTYGFSGAYRYLFSADPKGERVTFLDCRRQLDQFWRSVATSVAMAAAGYGVASLIIVLASKQLVRPLVEAQRKQRRFITDASHELRTPLSIILANADLLELEGEGDPESIGDIKSQVRRMESLTDDLVALARLEEAHAQAKTGSVDLSAVVQEAIAPYEAVAAQQSKELIVEVAPGLVGSGSAPEMGSLLGILLDNAFKYSPEGASVQVGLAASKDGKSAELRVSNATCEPLDPAQLPALFDRFYRTGESRASETGGHGIGLAMAKALVGAAGGTIVATAPERSTFVIEVSLPLHKNVSCRREGDRRRKRRGVPNGSS